MFIFNIVLITHQSNWIDFHSKENWIELGLVWIQVDQDHDHIEFKNSKGKVEFELNQID